MQYLFLLLAIFSCRPSSQSPADAGMARPAAQTQQDSMVPPQYAEGKLIQIQKSEAEWRRQLTEMEYYVLREEGTERAFTGDLWDNHEHGVYICRGCSLPLFSSETKFNSGTGWPSYYQPMAPEFVKENTDNSHGMTRTEVECARCGGHLGHVFPDGPPPTGLRYCINAVSLDFVKQ